MANESEIAKDGKNPERKAPQSRRLWLRFHSVLFAAALCIFAVLAAISEVQIVRSRTLYPEYPIPSQDDLGVPPTKLTIQKPGKVHSAIAFGAPYSGTARCVGSSAIVELPQRWQGYILHLGIEKYDHDAPPVIECLINGRKLSEYHIQNRRFSREKPYGGYEIPVAGKHLRHDGEDVLMINTSSGGYWEGRLYLIPGCLSRILLPFILPLSGFLVLLSTLLLPSSYRSRWFPFLVGAVMFIIYRYTSFIHNNTGFGGYFFEDIEDFIKSVAGDKYTHDMMKHPIFLPVIRVFYGIWRGIGLERLSAMSAGFALVAGINAALAFVWFRRACDEPLYALPLTVAYCMSFAVWAYSSLYETYVLSALSVHLTMILLWAKRVTEGLRNVLYTAIMIAISALVNPPMLLLVSVASAMLIMSGLPAKRKYLHACILFLAAVAIFLIGYYLVRFFYLSETAKTGGLHLPFADEFTKKGGVMKHYAGVSNMTLYNLLKVLAGQFIYSFLGQSYPFDYGLDNPVRYFTDVSGVISAVILLLFWIIAAMAMIKSKKIKTATVLLGTIVILPYILFFWYFNPSEMLLYSTPLLSLIMLWFCKASNIVLGGKTRLLFWAVAAVFFVCNMIAIVSYR